MFGAVLLCKKTLSFFDIDRRFSFRSFFGFKSDGVTFPQFLKTDSVQVVGVEEQVIAAFLGDKTEIFFGY